MFTDLVERFGDDMTTAYVDLYSGGIMEYPFVLPYAMLGGNGLPMTFVNGEPAVFGEIDAEVTASAIERARA